jgi:hypothetical protein
MEKEICKSRKNNICMGVHVEQYDNGDLACLNYLLSLLSSESLWVMTCEDDGSTMT